MERHSRFVMLIKRGLAAADGSLDSNLGVESAAYMFRAGMGAWFAMGSNA